jgi:DinB superfamily
VDMLENAIAACPNELWGDRSRKPEVWYSAYHTLFFLDLYASESVEAFVPPAPFTLSELDPAGVMPEAPYTMGELQTYLQYGRTKCRAAIEAMTDETARQRCGFSWLDLSVAELVVYNTRHVQHHTAQLNLVLRQTIDSAPGWVRRAGEKRTDP